MSISVLADGRALARIILPSSLLLQTAQLLQSRLGGLIGREIIHVPFSRRTSTGVETTKKYWQLHNSTRRHSGVVLALPEHILSFKLSGLQQLSDDRIPEAKAMIDAQNWFSQWSRDVMDEADSILAIRTQLIYPSGAQKTVDGHPHRCVCRFLSCYSLIVMQVDCDPNDSASSAWALMGSTKYISTQH